MKGWASSYYELPEGATELMDLIEYRGMSFAVGNIFKAAYRLGNKEGTTAEYDLRKIIWFAQRELDRITRKPDEDAVYYLDGGTDIDVHSFMRALRLDPDQ